MSYLNAIILLCYHSLFWSKGCCSYWFRHHFCLLAHPVLRAMVTFTILLHDITFTTCWLLSLPFDSILLYVGISSFLICSSIICLLVSPHVCLSHVCLWHVIVSCTLDWYWLACLFSSDCVASFGSGTFVSCQLCMLQSASCPWPLVAGLCAGIPVTPHLVSLYNRQVTPCLLSIWCQVHQHRCYSLDSSFNPKVSIATQKRHP